MKRFLSARKITLVVVCLLAIASAVVIVALSRRSESGSTKARTYNTLEEAGARLSEVQNLDKDIDVRPIEIKNFHGGAATSFLSWQESFRGELKDKLGVNKTERVQVIESLKPEKFFLEIQPSETGQSSSIRKVFYSREQLILKGAGGDLMKAWFLKPEREGEEKAERFPCVICLPGHSRLGVDSIVGIGKDGVTRTKYGGEYNDYALQFIEHGYAVLALEQRGMGTRRHELLKVLGINGNTPCELTAFLDGLGGTPTLGFRVSDVSLAIDYLCSRSDIDNNWFAVAGASAGGTTSLFSAALDKRIDCALVISYFNTFKDSILARRHCGCNYAGDLASEAEMSDVACLIAPRCLFIEYGCFDNYFPPEGALKAFAETRKGWEILGASDYLRKELAPRGHLGFSGKGLFEFMNRCKRP